MNNSLEVFSVFSNEFDIFIKTMQEIHGMRSSYIVNHSIFIGGMQFSRAMLCNDIMTMMTMTYPLYYINKFKRMSIIVSLLASGSRFTDKAWESIPKPLPKIERFLYMFPRDIRDVLHSCLTKKARHKIRERTRLLEKFLKNKKISQEIIEHIVLKSLKGEASHRGN